MERRRAHAAAWRAIAVIFSSIALAIPCAEALSVPFRQARHPGSGGSINTESASQADVGRILSLTRIDKRRVYLPDHLQDSATTSATVATLSRPSWRRQMVQNAIDRRHRRRVRLRAFARGVGAWASLLALWQLAAVATSASKSSLTTTAGETFEGKYQTPPVTRQDGGSGSVAATKFGGGRGSAAMVLQPTSRRTSSRVPPRTIAVASSSRGGGRRGKSVAPPPATAAERLREKIVQLSSQTTSLAKKGLDRTLDLYNNADGNQRTAAGIVAAGAVGIGVGVELAGRRKDKDGGEGEEEVLSNTDKLRREIEEEISWYNERYGTKGQGKEQQQQNNAATPAPAQKEAEVEADASSEEEPTGAAEATSSTAAEPSSSGGRKPDPRAQVKAILDSARERERKARQQRRIDPPPGTGTFDYSQVQGLSTTEGDGRSRAQRLIDSTADMERRAEAQRLELSRQRDVAEERASVETRRVADSLRDRIDNFIAVTEAEERNQGFGPDRPGDRGKALRAEVARLNGELDRSRSAVAALEAEVEEGRRVEALLRQEIDRLRRSG